MRLQRFSGLAIVIAGLGLVACDGNDVANSSQDPGALIGVGMDSTVGVLLDEVPAAMRDRVAQSLLAKPDDFWKQRAQTQVKLTTYRLVFRQFFYSGQKNRN